MIATESKNGHRSRLDRLVQWWSPERALRREQARTAEDTVRRWRLSETATHRGALDTRLDRPWPGSFSATGQRPMKLSTLRELRDRSRYVDRNFWLASALLGGLTDFVVGSGSRIEATSGDEEFDREAERGWEQFWRRPEVRGLFTGPAFERALFRTMFQDGDVAIYLTPGGKLQAILGDWIEGPARPPDGVTIVEGIQMAAGDRPVAYWIKQQMAGKTQAGPIPADRIVFLPRFKQLSDVRGTPVFSHTLTLFDQVDGYVESTVVAARMAACFGLIFREQMGLPFSAALTTTKDAQGASRPTIDLEPGMSKRVASNEEVVQVKPEHPHTQFGEFTEKLVRFASIDLGLPIEVAMMVFSASYSASRAALVTAQRAAKAKHSEFAELFLSRVYRWQISMRLRDPGDVLGEPRTGNAWDHKVIQQPWQYLDPTKEVEGELMEIAGGLTSRREALTRKGRNFDEWLSTEAQDQAKIRDAGVEVGTISRVTSGQKSTIGVG